MSVAVLTGGVGGAKLVLGLMHAMAPEDIVAIVNTGDDFVHLGLHVSPDIDTLLYTLSGRANAMQGWGREGESWSFMAALRELGGEDWFQLGDGDLALHVLRTLRLRSGEPLSAITRSFATAWSIGATVLPMTDQSVATEVETDAGIFDFQHYFVERRCAPAVRSIRFRGAGAASPATGVVEAILAAEAVLIAPSNPFLSVDPILAVPAVMDALRKTAAPVVAVSPIVGGEAVKGPTAKILRELGLAVDNRTIADRYAGWLDGLVVHEDDHAPDTLPIARTNTLMSTIEDRKRVASVALQLASEIIGVG